MARHRCATCEKRVGRWECAVLTQAVGIRRDCWAWSDDPAWDQHAQDDTRAYVSAVLQRAGVSTPEDAVLYAVDALERTGVIANG